MSQSSFMEAVEAWERNDFLGTPPLQGMTATASGVISWVLPSGAILEAGRTTDSGRVHAHKIKVKGPLRLPYPIRQRRPSDQFYAMPRCCYE